jgi:hypothetical protein
VKKTSPIKTTSSPTRPTPPPHSARLACLILCASASALLSGCPGPTSLGDPNITRGIAQAIDATDTSDPSSSDTSDPTTNSASEWTCDGELKVDYAGYQQETAFVAEANPNATQRAVDRARSTLLNRLCDGRPCDGLSEHLITHKTGAGNGQVCAMVVIKNKEFEAWKKKQDLGPFDDALLAAAQAMLKGAKTPLASIDKILDAGAAGGARASWLEARMKAALLRAGARYVEIPDGWDGQGIPDGVDVLISAQTAERTEHGDKVVDVTWEAHARGAKQRGKETLASERVSFLAVAAPEMTSPVQTLPPSDAKLSVRVESHKAGGLCAGELTSLKLFSADTLHVRVFNLYGQDGAILIYPPDPSTSDIVKGGKATSLNGAEDRFMVVPLPNNQVERFLVIAAKDPKDLGDLGNATGYCRLSPAKARALHKGQGIPPSAKAASDGFRLLPPSECQDIPEPPQDKSDEAQQVLLSLPECSP